MQAESQPGRLAQVQNQLCVVGEQVLRLAKTSALLISLTYR